MALRTLFAIALGFASAAPARAALVLEFIQAPAGTLTTTFGPLTGPALTSLTMDPGTTTFIQVALRDTIGSGPNAGQPGTVEWQTNNGAAGIGSLGLGAFFIRFDGIPGVAVNPAPQNTTNARLVNPIDYGTVTSGTNPPTFTRIGGLLNFGSEPGAVPDPTNQNRIALFNLRITAIAGGSGTFRLRDPNPSSGSNDNALLINPELYKPWVGYLESIDNQLFGASFTNTYDLPVVVTPEPSALALAAFAVAGFLGRNLRRFNERRQQR